MKKSRIVILFLFLLSMWSLMIFKAAHLQILPNEKLTHLKKKQYKKRINLASRRGAIVDRNGKELAISVASYSLFVDPSLVKNSKKLARKLAPILRMSSKKLYKLIKQKPRRFVWLKRNLSKEKKLAIKKLKVRALGFIEEPKRIYPNNHVLSQVLGVVGKDGRGLEGLELAQDEWLRGENKKIKIQKDARGRPLLRDGHVFMELPDGAEVTLTIDNELQYFLEREIKNTLEKHNAKSGVGVIVDAETSEVLALANAPTFNLNRPGAYSRKYWRNRSVTDAYEPGSTFKTLVIASALKTGKVQPNSRFDCENGYFRIGRRVIGEADTKHHFNMLSVSEILTHSSNIGTTKIAFKLGAEELRKQLLEFGIGKRTGVGLPGEVSGKLQSLPWNQHLLSNVSFGHGLTVTPLQMAMAYTAIANGGFLYKPSLIKSIEGEDSEDFKPELVRRVLTEEQSSVMKLMLTNSAANTAKIKGFQVAGKTGTAQKIKENGRGYEKGKYISSFAGFVPAHKPKFVIYVAIDSPEDKYYGSEVAAPIFSKVAQYAVSKYRLAPVLLNKASIMKKSNKKKKVENHAMEKITFEVVAGELGKNKVPPLQGLTLREVIQNLKDKDLKVQFKGTGVVVNTIPAEGEELPESKKIKIEFRPN